MLRVTFHSFAHYAFDRDGHIPIFQQALEAALTPEVEHVSVYLPKETRLNPLPNGWKPYFSKVNSKKGRKAFLRECRKLFREEEGEKRIFFLDYVEPRDFRLIALAAALFAKKRDHLWILNRFPPSFYSRRDRVGMGLFTHLLKWKFRSRFLPLTDSALLAPAYRDFRRREALVLPTVLHPPERSATYAPKTHLVCGYLGNPRKAKGESLIRALATYHPPQRASIELRVPKMLQLGEIEGGLTIRSFVPALSQEAYQNLFQELDFLLLPYDPEVYALRTSGIFIEALLAKKLPIVRKGTWMAKELARYGLIELCVNWEDPNFFAHLVELFHTASLWDRMSEMSEAYTQFHSVKTLRKLLKQQIL